MWLMLYLLQPWVVLVPKNTPLINASPTRWTCTQLYFPNLKCVSQPWPIIMTNSPLSLPYQNIFKLFNPWHTFKPMILVSRQLSPKSQFIPSLVTQCVGISWNQLQTGLPWSSQVTIGLECYLLYQIPNLESGFPASL